MKIKIPYKHAIIENLGIMAGKQKLIIQSFLHSYRTYDRVSRQIGLIALGLASALGYGANQIQIQHIKSIIKDLKKGSLHRDNKIAFIESAVDFNSKTLVKLERVQNEVIDIIFSEVFGRMSAF